MSKINKGQIRYMYLWVHPQWKSGQTNEINELEFSIHKRFTGLLSDSKECGLIQVAIRPRRDMKDNLVYQKYLKQIEEFDIHAKTTLGQRYLVWKKDKFIDFMKKEHIDEVINSFNLELSNQFDFVLEKERYLTKLPKYLAKISVFGKEVGLCPLVQATFFDLRNIASVVKYHAEETPRYINKINDDSGVYIF